MYCKIPDIFRQWRNMVGSILFVLQNSWHFGPWYNLLYLYCKIQTVEEYGRIYFICTHIFKVSWLFWKFFGNSLGIFKRWRNMVGSIWFVLTFSKSADYFGNFFGILWKLSLIVYIFKSLIVGAGVWKFLIWEDFRLNGQGQGQGKTITRSASWRFLALKKIFFLYLEKKYESKIGYRLTVFPKN